MVSNPHDDRKSSLHETNLSCSMTSFLTAAAAVLGGLCALALLYLLVLVRPRGGLPSDPALLCPYAHRGLHSPGIPENSLAAFEEACRQGFGIELDVQLSRDGVVMVFHDYTLTRMTGADRKLRELDCVGLQALPLQGTDQTIPTLEEVLRLVDGRVPLLIELKGESLDTSLCGEVARLLSDYRGAYCIESFHPLLVRGMRKHLPGVYCGLLYTNVCREGKTSPIRVAGVCMLFNSLAKPNFIAYNRLDRHALPIRLATGLYSAPRFVWTIRSEEAYREAISLGENPIFENLMPNKNGD